MIDRIAERIRALDQPAPGSLQRFSELYPHSEVEMELPNSEGMIQSLIRASESAVSEARRIVQIAQDVGDDVTSDLLIKTMYRLEKNIWMLRATVQ